jgi:hypothetical protein
VPGNAQSESEFLAFPHINASYLSGLADGSPLDSDEFDYGLDLFAVVEYRHFLFLGEALLAKEEQDIERLQLGRRIGDSKVWLGRFHNPVGYWNTQFHHGAYMETSITRPAIVDFEDDNGPLPMHLTGLLIEGLKERDGSGLGYAIALAAGPELTDELEPLKILDPGSGSQDLALTVNVYRQPVVFDPTQYGLFVNYTKIPAASRGFEEIRQLSAGGYLNWEPAPWRLIGSAFYVRNRMYHSSAVQEDDFFSGYFQAENALNDKWKIYGRLEGTFGGDNDAYLALFPDLVQDRVLGGVRLDVFDRHSFKLEISANRTQADNFRQLMLQWDAMF